MAYWSRLLLPPSWNDRLAFEASLSWLPLEQVKPTAKTPHSMLEFPFTNQTEYTQRRWRQGTWSEPDVPTNSETSRKIYFKGKNRLK